ncbi:MAG: cytochrome b/b6 domain-containing protein [Burkholderiaceae bacterium]|nr:cytochrome b/b6 domain-containing protein [Burkholderiaceae bacterium]
MKSIRVWDLPTRVFHWSLVLCFIGLLITGTMGGNAMPWHFRFGYGLLTLLLFRLIWGVVGGKWSRFTSFIYSPRSIRNYIQGQAPVYHLVGHNPLGSVSVFALLGFLSAQVATGLISDDEIAAAGPLSKFVSNATVSLASGYHTKIGKVFLIALVLLHVLAVLFYLYKKRENLIKPMIHGDKVLPIDVPASRDDAASRAWALLILAASAGFVYWLVSLGG